MGRVYIAQFAGSAKTAAGDLFEVICPADAVLIIHEIRITQSTEAGDAQSEQMQVTVKRASGTYTSGSGGGSATAVPVSFGDPAFGGTVETNNSTPASAGTGALTTLMTISENVHNGFHYLPTPETRIQISPSQALVVALASTPADSITFDGVVVFEELGG